jgi:HEAT repeat protein
MQDPLQSPHISYRSKARWLSTAALALLSGLALAQDPLKDIKAKEPEKRVAAIAALEASGGEGAEKALVSALLDKDWEVVERAAVALGKVGSKTAIPQLVKTALDAPAMRLRRAAAISLLRIDAARATEDLAKQTAGKNALNAWSALAIVAAQGAGAESEGVAKNLKKSQKSKELDERLAAAGAIGAASLEDMAALLSGYLGGADAELACAALGAVAVRPDASFVPLLEAELTKDALGDVVERRVVRGLAAIARVDAAAVVAALERLAEGSPQSAARAMRLARSLSSVADAKSTAELRIERGLSHSDADVRAAALHAGGALDLEPVLKKARELAAKDGNPRVRLVALQELRDSVGDDAVLGVFTARLSGDTDAEVREAAAAALGRSRSELAVKALVAALDDKAWQVAVCAAVSLGKTTQESAVAPLLALSKHDDWKRRGAAIVGLSHVTKSEAVPAILAATADGEPSVALTALACAKALTKQDFGRDSAAWQKWWSENGAKLKLWTPEELKARREKFGYALSVAEVFKDLDVIVLESRGDQIQSVLERVETGMVAAPAAKGKDAVEAKGVPYRKTMAGKHREDGLQPFGVYVSNCTGEVLPEDLECISWFVRTGGYVFGSCWALGETIQKIYPNMAKSVHLENELATVSAEPIAEGSPYLAGVFDGGVQPHYNLEGPHMIEVVDRERCEVLVDSPQCAAKYGVGNMTVWFRAGHGLVCDSVNHFNNQGLVNATWLKEAEQRQAYAVDRMALPWSQWRATASEKWWGSNGKAAEHVFDRTALSLVTNFVRSKRQEEL